MRETLLWMKYDFYNRLCGIAIFIAKKCTKLGNYCVERQKDIYHEATGRKIL